MENEKAVPDDVDDDVVEVDDDDDNNDNDDDEEPLVAAFFAFSRSLAVAVRVKNFDIISRSRRSDVGDNGMPPGK